MRYMLLSALAGSWLFTAPVMWAHRPEKAVLGAVLGFLVMALSPLGIVSSRARFAIAMAGAVVGLSNFFFYDGFSVLVSDVVVGLALFVAGMAPSPQVTVVPAVAAMAAPRAQEPQRLAA